ncbi:MAG TPA: HEAT repeat domain-containing protein [Thermoanaerobaculia bacterium]|nr:HEAT repeat domain-containing protein [Thermoanaerobaculia bacterium]
MRKLAPFVLVFGIACSTGNPQSSILNPQSPAAPYGLTIAEEARILALEDRRELDPALVAQWVKHPNPLHRLRIAMALARIGPHNFLDARGSNAGVAELTALASDPDRRVREAAAFGLGEIGDPTAIDTLFTLTNDADSGVAAEAAEAVSKLRSDANFIYTHLPRYLWMIADKYPEGLRARAVRYLFRFDSPDAMNAAMRSLASTSSAVRQEAAYALARKAHPPARAQLELLLTDPNTLTRAYAATALGRIGEGASAPAILTALGDVHPWVRTNAAVALGRIAEKDPSIVKMEDLPRIFAALDDADPGVRASMIDTMAYYAEKNETAQARLINLLLNGSKWERELAVGAIPKHFGPESGMFRYPTNLTPWMFVRLFEASSTKPSGPSLRASYANDKDAMVRANVISTIPDDRVNAEIELIRTAFNDADVIVRTNAYDRYSHSTLDPEPERLKKLQEAEVRERTAEANDARVAAISAIAEIKSPARVKYLQGFLEDSDLVVRRLASDLLYGIDHVRRPYTPLPVARTQAEYEEIARWSRQSHTATIHMPRGNIELALLTQDAPMTAWNFAQLAKKGYFNNTTFMRVVPNFVIQGGDPRNDQNGGPGYVIRDEINLQKYTRGAVGMALSGPDTGGSQFFITHSPQPHLDGGYTIFARVYDGMTSVVDQVERGDRVDTIAIDEKPSPGAEKIAISNVSLPLQIGPMTAERLLATVPEYQQRKTDYAPDLTVVEMMKSYVRPGDRVEVYMGTWCSDSQREVPKFLRILDELRSQYQVELPVTFVAVDRAKQKPAELIEGKHLEKVATFIYYRGNEELGRIVEKPVAVFEDDLLAIVAKQ